jgi:predicted CXXCH cytochrome family protein
MIVMGGVAFATYPHGDFANNSDVCAACHRMHTATATNLMKDINGAMCTTCHQNGAGADTNVMGGFYVEDAEADHQWGVDTATLLGGGFTTVGAAVAPATSKHDVNASVIPPGADTGTAISLKCISCHSPHPDKNNPDQYRLLRIRPGTADTDRPVVWNGPWEGETQAVPDGGDYRAYTEHDFDAGKAGVQYYTRNYQSGVAAWCSGCHRHYLADDTHPGFKEESTYDSGDIYGDVARHRHSVNVPITGRTDPVNGVQYNLVTDLPLEDTTPTDGRSADDTLTCLSCHRAHGTEAAMTGLAVLEDRGSILPDGTDSLLLRLSDRTMCRDCHGF